MGWHCRAIVVLLAVVISSTSALRADAVEEDFPLPRAAPVVVASFDTGTNPFHPCFRREGLQHPRSLVPDYPKDSIPLRLKFKKTYQASLSASLPELQRLAPETLYHVPGTNLSYFGGDGASIVDTYGHGAQASSMIACDQFGLGSNAQLIVINEYDSRQRPLGQLLSWVAAQPWVDVIHINLQDTPYLLFDEPAIADAIRADKMLVIAAGNGVGGLGVNYPTEFSKYNGPPGSLTAGANDNGGWTWYSNLDPHVVMDGGNTVGAHPSTYGTTSFGGTSSSSPLITGYVTRLLGIARARFGHTGRGLLTIPEGRPSPDSGPLSDGKLTPAELHEAVRKTANPNPHESRFDGALSVYWVPQPVALPFAVYPKMGYGEVSEHTLPNAVAVLAGELPMPIRPHEDRFYERSEELRRALWD